MKNISSNRPNKLKKFFLYGKSFLPLFLSHHPECVKFKNHTLVWGRYKFCIGCFIGYPVAVFSLIIFSVLNLADLFPTQIFFLLSIVCLATFFLSPLNLTKNKKVKIAQKALIGLGTALLVIWISKLGNSKRINTIIMVIIINFLVTVLNIYHVYGILSTCNKCETPFEWGECSGFCLIRERMKKYNLNNFLLYVSNFSFKLKKKKKEGKKGF